MKALGLIEVYGFTTALYAADLMAKAADVKIIAFDRNRPFNPGFPVPLIMVAKIEGTVSGVNSAIEVAREYAESKGRYIVSHVIPRPEDSSEKMAFLNDINRDKFNKNMPKTMKDVDSSSISFSGALGIIEVEGFVCSVETLDTMLKAAEVRLVHTEERLGGRLVTLVITGEVSAVKAAVEAGKNNASKFGKVYGDEVIARPHNELLKFFDLEAIGK